MLSRFRELLWYAAGPLAIFATSPMLAQGLGAEDRGELGLAQAVATFGAAVGALGQPEVLLADFRAGRHTHRVASLTAAVTSGLTATGAYAACLMLGTSALTAAAVALTMPLLTQAQLWRSIVVAMRNTHRPALTNFLGAVLRVILVGVLFLTGVLAVGNAMLAIQAAAVIASIVALWTLARRAETLWPTTYRANPRMVGAQIVKGAPMIAFNVLTSITLRSDLLVLSRYVSARELGIYAATSTLSTSVLSVSGAFKTRVQAVIVARASRAEIVRELGPVVAASAVVMVGALVAAPIVVAALLGPGFEDGVPLLRVLSVGSAGLLWLDVAHGAIVALGNRLRLLAVASVGASVTAGLLFALVPANGAMGAAVATAGATWAAAATGMLIVLRGLRGS